MKNLISSILSIVGVATFAQTSLIFNYDAAGNQVLRGIKLSRISNPTIVENNLVEVVDENKAFWDGIRIYPVPVKNILTIDWNEENNQLIDNVSIYQHTTLASLFSKQNVASLNRQVTIDMTHYYMGVYVLSFKLKDGRVISKNIIKTRSAL